MQPNRSLVSPTSHPQLEHEHVPTVWHTSTIVGAALLVVLGLAGLVV